MTTPTKQEIRNAIVTSIEHWKNNETLPFGQTSVSGEDCALCEIFVDEMGTCDGCPVKEYTQNPSCRQTPYHYAARAWHDANFHSYSVKSIKDINIENFRQSAKAEREFLEMLLRDFDKNEA